MKGSLSNPWIPGILGNPEFHCRVLNSPPLVRVLDHTGLLYTAPNGSNWLFKSMLYSAASLDPPPERPPSSEELLIV
jgi:hypothetical protein